MMGSRLSSYTTVFGLPLLLAAAASPQKSATPAVQVPPPAETIIPSLGLKMIVSLPKFTGRRPHPRPQVSAVLEGSPAFLAGIQPGDFILSINNKAFGNPFFIVNFLAKFFPPEYRASLELEYDTVPPGPLPTAYAQVYPEAARTGNWITTRLQHPAETSSSTNSLADMRRAREAFQNRQQLPGVLEARNAAKSQYQELFAKTSQTVAKDACAFFKQDALRTLEWWANKAKLNDDDETLRARSSLERDADRACNIAKLGGIPEFEAVVVAMHRKAIDPCAYRPDAPEVKAAVQEVRSTRSTRDYLAFDLGRRGMQAQRAPGRMRVRVPGAAPQRPAVDPEGYLCLLSFLESSLMGKEFVPVARVAPLSPPEAAPAAPPAEVERAPGGRRAPGPRSPGPVSQAPALGEPALREPVSEASAAAPSAARTSAARTSDPPLAVEPPAVARPAEPAAAAPASVAPPSVVPTSVLPQPAEVTAGARRRGELIWSGRAAKGEIITLSGQRPSTGNMKGALPGVPVKIRLFSRYLKLEEEPSPANQWTTLRVRTLDSINGSVLIEWMEQ